jgi:hypothetical protein
METTRNIQEIPKAKVGTKKVYYADSDLCDPIVNKTEGYPVRDKDPNTGQMYPWVAPFILMADRGKCTFVTKVRELSQREGALIKSLDWCVVHD